MSRLAERLGGRRIGLTGATGSLGRLVAARVLTDLPDARLTLLVRRRGARSPEARVAELASGPLFVQAVSAAGGLHRLLAERVDVVECDLPEAPELPPMDVLIHCAAVRDPDPPIDQAFAVNVVGSARLVSRLAEAGTPSGGPDAPHFVHLSATAVAGRGHGIVSETALERRADHEAETRQVERLVDHLEADSRTGRRLARLRRGAESTHWQAGSLSVSEETERRRAAWVRSALVAAGSERARSLGWANARALAQALSEAAVEDAGAKLRVSIVRPALAGATLRFPNPGCLDRLSTLDQMMLAYASGQSRHLETDPDAVVDIVPGDMVANLVLAVCATSPTPGAPTYYHCSSGARNPLTVAGARGVIRRHFSKNPTTAAADPLSRWELPAVQRTDLTLRLAEASVRAATRALALTPRSRGARRLAERLDRSSNRLAQLGRRLHGYQERMRSRRRVADDAALALHRGLAPADQERFGFDVGQIDWPTYLDEAHLPAITSLARRHAATSARAAPRSDALAAPVRAKRGERVLAVFDLDGTLLATNVVETYLWSRLPELGPLNRARELVGLATRLPAHLGAERRDRGVFLRSVYARYAGADMAALERFVDSRMSALVLDRMSPAAIRRVRAHREAGHATVLMTGVIRPLTRPLEPLFDEIVAADLDVGPDGRCTGRLRAPAVVGEARAAWLARRAQDEGVDLAKCHAYADSMVDLPMLAEVGRPVAVNPDLGLLREARRRSWPVVEWPAMSPIPRWRMPN